MIHKVKGFSVANEAEVDVFLEFFGFFYDPTAVGNLISSSSAFSMYLVECWNLSIFLTNRLELGFFRGVK